MNAFFLRIRLILLVLFLGACSGGGTDLAQGGIGGTGFTEGPISGFGSIFVNGIQYDTNQAEILINGEAAADDALRLGMVVAVDGEHDGVVGSAERIEFQEDLRGPVTGVDNSLGLLWVLGQTVSVDTLTVFEGVDALAQLRSGDVVQISGLGDTQGGLRATRIVLVSSTGGVDSEISTGTEEDAASITPPTMTSPAPLPAQQLFTVRGRIAELDNALGNFKLGDLLVHYGNARSLPSLREGAVVVVTGSLEGAVLNAAEVRAQQPLVPADPNARVVLTGVVGDFVSLADFDIGQVGAQADRNTEFLFGSAADLAPGVEVTVTGKPGANGRLQLERVELHGATELRTAPGQVQISARVQAVDSGRESIQLAGVQVRVDRTTQFRDALLAQNVFNLNHVSTADTVSVFGFLDLANSEVRAERVQRERFAAGDTVRLQGPLEAADAAAGRFRVLGSTLEVDAQTRFFDDSYLPAPPPPPSGGNEARPGGGVPVSQPQRLVNTTAFFARAAQNRLLIEANGVLAGDVILVDQVVLLPQGR